MIVKWIIIVLFINLIWFLPLLEQWNLHDIINDKVFQKVKIKGKMSFFFNAIGGQSVSSHGAVKALLFLQVKGYVLALGSIISVITLWCITKESMFCLYVMFGVLLFSIVIDSIVIVILMIISKRRSVDK